MAESPLDLAKLFSAVTDALSENQDSLNEADSYNSNHGDNMVEIFKTITKAVDKKKKADAGEAFAYASELLKKEQSSGSAATYAEGLRHAAKTFKSKNVTPENAFELIRSLLGGRSISTLDASELDAGDLGSILQKVQGAQQVAEASGLDLEELLSMGMAFAQAQQQGGSAIEALIKAIVSGGVLGGSQHRSKSGMLVGNTLMKILGSLTG
jgi:hypothetical protein